MAEIAKRPVSDGEGEWVCEIYVIREAELLIIYLPKNT